MKHCQIKGNLKSQNTDTINGWKKGGTLGFTFSQVSLTNWAAGGVNSFSVIGSWTPNIASPEDCHLYC